MRDQKTPPFWWRNKVSGDMIMLKPLDMPSEDDFKNLDQAATWAQEVGYKESDINDIVKEYRANKKSQLTSR